MVQRKSRSQEEGFKVSQVSRFQRFKVPREALVMGRPSAVDMVQVSRQPSPWSS